MIRNTLFIILLVILSTAHDVAKGQELVVGLKGGFDVAKIDGISLKGKFNGYFFGGGYARVQMNKWNIQADLLYTQTNMTTAESFQKAFKQFIDSTTFAYQNNQFHLTEVAIPLVLGYRIYGPIKLELGIQYSMILHIADKNEILIKPRDVFDNGYTSLILGAGVEYKRLNVGIRHLKGYSNINKTDVPERWETGRFQFHLGLDLIRI